MERLNIGIIGSGAIANVHAKGVQSHSKAVLKGMVCSDEKRAQTLSDAFINATQVQIQIIVYRKNPKFAQLITS